MRVSPQETVKVTSYCYIERTVSAILSEKWHSEQWKENVNDESKQTVKIETKLITKAIRNTLLAPIQQ